MRHDRSHKWLLLPSLLLIIVFLAAPAIYVGWLSVHESTFGKQPVYVGLQNYARLVEDPVFWRAFWNTFFVVNGIAYGELILGLLVAVLIRDQRYGRPLLIAVILAPYAITESSGIVMWRYMLEPDVGILSTLISKIGFGTVAWSSDATATLALASLIAIWHHLPFTFLILFAALLIIPKEILEAAEVDGASRWQRFMRIELRIIIPAILIALMFRYIFAIRLFSEIWLLTQGGPARLSEVLSIYLYKETFQYREFGIASAVGWVMVLMSLAIALPYIVRMYREIARHG